MKPLIKNLPSSDVEKLLGNYFCFPSYCWRDLPDKIINSPYKGEPSHSWSAPPAECEAHFPTANSHMPS